MLREVRERFGRERPLAGLRISACLDVTATGANLVQTLAAGGAEVVLCAASPGLTEDDVAAALVVGSEIAVLAVRGEEPDRYYAHLDAACDHRPQLVIDSGGDLVGTLHAARREQLGYVLAGVEETDAGVMRAGALANEGALAFPIVDLGDAETVRLVERSRSDAESTLERIGRETGTFYGGARLAVIGYGRRGRTLARRARERGARVVVAEADPLRALEATLDGFEVAPLADALDGAHVVVVATSRRRAIAPEDVAHLRDGVVVVSLDGRSVAIDAHVPQERNRPRPSAGVEVVALADGRVIRILRVVGHRHESAAPAVVADVRLATAALALEHLAAAAPELDRGVYPVPGVVDRGVAVLALAALGVDGGFPSGEGV